MRLVLLAFLSLVLMAPKAEAARRDDDRSRTTSQSASGTKGAKADPRRSAPAAAPVRSAVAPAPRAATPTRNAARSPAAAPTRSAARTQPASRGRTASRATVRPQAQADAGQARTQRTGIVVRGANAATVSRNAATCTRRNGRTVCGPSRSGIAGWQAGLPQVSMAQRDCPAGTFATLARGHDDIVRCMPL
jgi:hypothetical protein